MDNEKFVEEIERALATTSKDIVTAPDVSKRETAVKNFKMVSDIMIDYQKMQYAHAENQKRIEIDEKKLESDKEKSRIETELKYTQMDVDDRRYKSETIVKMAMYGVKAVIMIGATVMAVRFETGGNWTSTLGRAIFPSFGKTIVDDVTRI